jgi:hypothetical protein
VQAGMKRLGSSVARSPIPPSPRIRMATLPPTGAAPKIPQGSKTAIPPPSSFASYRSPYFSGWYERNRDRGPVSWTSLFLVTVVATSAVAYYSVERERRLERAMGKVVSSESDDSGWTPHPGSLAKRKFVKTKYGWFPVDDGFGARECLFLICSNKVVAVFWAIRVY